MIEHEATFDVFVVASSGAPADVAAAITRVFGVGDEYASSLLASVPCSVRGGCSWDDAMTMARHIESAQATAAIRDAEGVEVYVTGSRPTYTPPKAGSREDGTPGVAGPQGAGIAFLIITGLSVLGAWGIEQGFAAVVASARNQAEALANEGPNPDALTPPPSTGIAPPRTRTRPARTPARAPSPTPTAATAAPERCVSMGEIRREADGQPVALGTLSDGGVALIRAVERVARHDYCFARVRSDDGILRIHRLVVQTDASSLPRLRSAVAALSLGGGPYSNDDVKPAVRLVLGQTNVDF